MDLADKLHHYLAMWELAEPHLLAETYTSRIYTVAHGGGTAILKLLAPHEIEEQRGAAALRCFAGRRAVHLLRSDAGAQLLEYAGGPELFTVVARGEDAEATRIIAQVIAQLHDAPQPRDYGEIVPLDRWFGALFAQADADREAGRATIYVRGGTVAAELLAAPRDVRVLHGDIHHYNIRHSPRGWLAFDPKGLVGERTYDCANTLCNPAVPALVFDARRLLANAAILADALGLDRRRILAFTYAYACLNASQWRALGSGGEMQQWSLRVAALVEPHLAGGGGA